MGALRVCQNFPVCVSLLDKLNLCLGKGSNNQNGNLRWHLPLGVRPPPPPPLMAKFSDIFLPHFFSFAIESYIYETDFTLQKYHFKSSYSWFKIDIHQQVRPLTANYLAMFKVISTTIYTKYKAQTKCKTRFHSQGMILNGFFKKKSFFKIGMWHPM